MNPSFPPLRVNVIGKVTRQGRFVGLTRCGEHTQFLTDGEVDQSLPRFVPNRTLVLACLVEKHEITKEES